MEVWLALLGEDSNTCFAGHHLPGAGLPTNALGPVANPDG